jgi:hypothetical protein
MTRECYHDQRLRAPPAPGRTLGLARIVRLGATEAQ